MKNAATIVGGVLVLAGIAGILALRGGGDPGPATPAPSSPPPTAPPAPDGPPFEILCRRSRDEVLVFARRREFGRPGSGIEIRILGTDGAVLRIGRTDEFGVLRSDLPEGAVSVTVVAEGAEISAAIPLAPPPAETSIPILADRSVLRPGDIVRFCVRALGAPEGVLRFEPADPGVDEVVFSRTEELVAGFPGPVAHWIELKAKIPDDVRPGRAVATIGGQRLEFPIVPRFGPPTEGPPVAPPRPPATPSGALRLSSEDETWRIECPEEMTSFLLFGLHGDELETHMAGDCEGREAIVHLPLRQRNARCFHVIALVSTARGFLEASTIWSPDAPSQWELRVEPVARKSATEDGDAVEAFLAMRSGPEGGTPGDRKPAAVAIAAEDATGESADLAFVDGEPQAVLPLAGGGDRRVRAVACPSDRAPPLFAEATFLAAHPPAPSSGPSWIYEGDVAAGVGTQPPTRPTMLAIRRHLQVGEPAPFPEPGIAVPRGTLVHWTVPPVREPTPVRVRAGDEIVIEAFAAEDGEECVMGEIESQWLGDRPILLESRRGADPGLAVDLYAEIPIRSAEVAASAPEPMHGLALSREIPERVAADGTAVVRVRIAAAAAVDRPFVARLPLPRGAVPAEDGWSIRKSAPTGTRVELSEDLVTWQLPRVEPGAVLSVRVRFPWRGRFAAPPATIVGGEAPRPSARSAGAVVVVE